MSEPTANPANTETPDRRNHVMVGELPSDFLRVGGMAPSQQQQCMADERVAQILQAQQQAGYTMMPANVRGKLSISIAQAKLAKNYGITKMDPYCRIRVGHAVFETPTAYNGSKNPRWHKEVHCYLPQGVDNMYVEIFDERSFTVDDRVAWGYITLPAAVFNGETVDEWFPLSGRQGDEKEGTLNLVLSFTEMESLPPSFQPGLPMYLPPQPLVYTYPGVPAAAPGMYPPQTQIPPVGPAYTDEDFKQVKEMFPNMDEEIIRSVYDANPGNKDSTINSLLQMSAD